jgi:uncharacterized protein (DUF302 family)
MLYQVQHCKEVALANTDLVMVASDFGQSETIARLEATIARDGLTIFAKIDHSAAATAVHLKLRPTVLLVFGNPVGGTPLMLARQSMGIDLPLRALVHQDSSERVWVAYYKLTELAKSHGLTAATVPSLEKLSEGLDRIVAQSTTAHPPCAR